MIHKQGIALCIQMTGANVVFPTFLFLGSLQADTVNHDLVITPRLCRKQDNVI